jgi:hypothetical protein
MTKQKRREQKSTCYQTYVPVSCDAIPFWSGKWKRQRVFALSFSNDESDFALSGREKDRVAFNSKDFQNRCQKDIVNRSRLALRHEDPGVLRLATTRNPILVWN